MSDILGTARVRGPRAPGRSGPALYRWSPRTAPGDDRVQFARGLMMDVFDSGRADTRRADAVRPTNAWLRFGLPAAVGLAVSSLAAVVGLVVAGSAYETGQANAWRDLRAKYDLDKLERAAFHTNWDRVVDLSAPGAPLPNRQVVSDRLRADAEIDFWNASRQAGNEFERDIKPGLDARWTMTAIIGLGVAVALGAGVGVGLWLLIGQPRRDDRRQARAFVAEGRRQPGRARVVRRPAAE